MKTRLTASERNFQKYCQQRGLCFWREPFDDRGPKPDYLFLRQGKRILVEVKELDDTPFSREMNRRIGIGHTATTFTLDQRALLNMLRERIKEGCRQLKPYQDRVDYSLVLIALQAPIDEITAQDIFHAMYGDPVLKWQVNRRTGAAVEGSMKNTMRVNGQLRKNDRDRGVMFSPHGAYLSGVGILQRFHAASYYQKKYLSRFKAEARHHSFRQHFYYLERRWALHRPDVPAMYRDPRRFLYRIVMVSNALGQRPLPTGVINGRWDEFGMPRVRER